MEKVAIVTGANRGIGLALVRGLCRLWGTSGRVYLTARDTAKGAAAVSTLEAEGLHPLFHALDIADPTSIAALAEHIRATHGGIDLLLLNGAYAPRPGMPARDDARPMIAANNHGTRRMLEAFRSLLRDGARVVVTASGYGTLASLPPHLRPRFLEPAPDMAGVDAIMDAYVAAVEAGTDRDQGWPEWVNPASKVGQVATMRAFARAMADEARRRDILINAVCPGWTETDATRTFLADMPDVKAKQPDEAAIDVIWLATLPPGTREPYGELVQYRRSLAFVPRTN